MRGDPVRGRKAWMVFMEVNDRSKGINKVSIVNPAVLRDIIPLPRDTIVDAHIVTHFVTSDSSNGVDTGRGRRYSIIVEQCRGHDSRW